MKYNHLGYSVQTYIEEFTSVCLDIGPKVLDEPLPALRIYIKIFLSISYKNYYKQKQ